MTTNKLKEHIEKEYRACFDLLMVSELYGQERIKERFKVLQEWEGFLFGGGEIYEAIKEEFKKEHGESFLQLIEFDDN